MATTSVVAQTAAPWVEAALGPLGLLVFLLVVVVVGGTKKFWVFGWVLESETKRCDEISRERDYWRNTAFKSLNVGQDAVHAAVKVAPEHSLEEMAQAVDEARLRGELPP